MVVFVITIRRFTCLYSDPEIDIINCFKTIYHAKCSFLSVINTAKCIEHKIKTKIFRLLLVVCIRLHACTHTLSQQEKKINANDLMMPSYHQTEIFSSIDICTIFY